MGYRFSINEMDEIIAALRQNYRVIAPKRMRGKGGKKIRFGEISSATEIVLDEQSDFSMKEWIHPIQQTLFYITEDEFRISELPDEREMIIFARPCDINGVKRLDQMFLKNGNRADNFYARRRELVHFFLLECTESFKHCYCVSMGANETSDYEAAVRFEGEDVYVSVKEPVWETFFGGGKPSDYEPQFVQKNSRTVRIPDLDGIPKEVTHAFPLWKAFDNVCLGCGGCNTVCISCSCFDTMDISYGEKIAEGERRRIWGSCMLKPFSHLAGGRSPRQLTGERIRFKTMHKIHDYNARFHAGPMCVGCGRCEKQCPKHLSFAGTINVLNKNVEQWKAGQKKEEYHGSDYDAVSA